MVEPIEPPRKVLVIEDYPDDVKLIERVIRRLPIPVDFQWVDNGPDAVRLSERSEPLEEYFDLVLLDSRLRGESGFEVLKALRRADPMGRVPIVLLVGAMGDDFSDVALGHGADACVVKPLAPDQFMEKVRRILDTWLEITPLA